MRTVNPGIRDPEISDSGARHDTCAEALIHAHEVFHVAHLPCAGVVYGRAKDGHSHHSRLNVG